MQKLLKDYLDELNKKQKRRRKSAIALTLVAVMLISTVAWNLAEYGIAMTGDPKCGLEEHQHSEACYEDVLICGQEESAGHTHTDACRKTEQQLVCGQEESAGHTHTDACFQTEQQLVCGQEESAEHTHTEACYTTVQTQICGQEESAGHTHSESCYTTVETYTCEQEESAGHTHTEACYEKQLVCGKEEHTHSDACFIDPKADVEDASVWNTQYANIQWKDAWGEDLVTAAEKQIGYKESVDNYTVTENEDHKGYTRYGQFAGDVYADWDAAFVNFCMYYAGLEATNLFPKETETAKWYDKFAQGVNRDYLTAPAEYEPQVGDLVFFRRENEETENQMGIVSSYNKEKNEIQVIEGNVDNAVKENKYAANDVHITAYLKISELEAAYKNIQTEIGEEEDEEQPEEKDIFYQEEQFTQTAETENYVVTVQYGSDAALPGNAELKVEEYGRDSEEFTQKTEELGYEPEWLLNIGFYDGENEVEPEGSVTVKVRSKAAKEIADCDIIHFKEEGTEKLESTSQNVEEGDAAVEFTTDSFSFFAGVLAAGDETGGDGGTTAPAEAETEGDLGEDLSHSGETNSPKNDWQIVDQGFKGSTSEHKKTSSDDMVRVQKNVVPTDVENEFKVYLSIDMNSWWQNFLESAEYLATTSNDSGGQGQKPGDIRKKNITGSEKVRVSREPFDGCKGGTEFILKDTYGNVLAKIKLYWSATNNFTIYLPLGIGKDEQGKDVNWYLLLGVSVRAEQVGGTEQVVLEPDIIDEINKITERYSVKLDKVTDTMGDYIIFQGVERYTEETTVVEANDKRSLTWYVNSVPSAEDGWDTNVAELVYKVKLDVKKEVFDSCADNMTSKVGNTESYKVNENATLNYTYITEKGTGSNVIKEEEVKELDFQVPYVRGLLYDYRFIKKGQNFDLTPGWVLPGAKFKLEKVDEENGEEKLTLIEEKVSGQDGKIEFVDLEWGTYRITETEVPEGYKKIDPFYIRLCYTTDKVLLEQDKAPKESNMVIKEANEGEGIVKYDPSELVDITVQKLWDDNNAVNSRPETITVKLKGTVQPKDAEEPIEIDYDSCKTGLLQMLEQTLQTDSWNYTWENLPTRDNNGNLITWSVEEVTGSDGFGKYQISYKGYEKPAGFQNIPEVDSPDTASENQSKTYYIVNQLKQEWSIVKKSSSDGGKLLAGAEFELTNTDGDVTFYGLSNEKGVVEWYTDKEHQNKIEVEAIPNGSYTLTETKAPTGYILSTVIWNVDIGVNGEPIKIMQDGKEVTHTEGEIWSYIFENEVLYSLPSTGGSGIYWYIFSGVLLMAVAMLIIYKNKCKEVIKG